MSSQLTTEIDRLRYFPFLKLIAVTGGPCAGKSTFMRMAVNLLQKQGLKVIVVPETAREVIAAGFHPADKHWKSSVSFQSHVFRTQLEREINYFRALMDMNLNGQQAVFLCDRGLVDGMAYMPEAEFLRMLEDFGITFAQALDHYNCVVNLVSAACGAEAFYATDSERFETLAEAKALETRTVRAWHEHQHLTVVDNSTDFPEKMNRALFALNRTLNLPMATEIEKKYLVRNFSFDLIPTDAKSFEILQRYLDRKDRPGVECRVRQKATRGESSYYYTEKTPTKIEGMRGESEEQITEAKFKELQIFYSDRSCVPVHKIRYKFQEGPNIFELDVFDGKLKGLVLLEVEFTSQDDFKSFVPPPRFDLLDVTADKRYSNRSLAQHGIPY